MLKNEGKRPDVPLGTVFKVVYRDGTPCTSTYNDELYWYIDGSHNMSDIMEYEVVNDA